MVIVIITVSQNLYSQEGRNSIEVFPYFRYDQYPDFSYRINSVTDNVVKLSGLSWGISGTYKYEIHKNIFLKLGIGYYRYSFNKIKRTNSSFGESNTRSIDYPSTLDLLFYTDKYWYNTVVGMIGTEKAFPLNRDVQFVAGVNFNSYYTFSQQYHIEYSNPDNPIENNYKTSNNRFFGFSAEVRAGIQKKFNKFSLGPHVIFPIFDSWKQDEVFPQEKNSDSRTKWLRGIGAGIAFSYSL